MARVTQGDELGVVALRGLARQGREQHDAERDADDADGDLQQRERDRQGRHGADPDGRWRVP